MKQTPMRIYAACETITKQLGELTGKDLANYVHTVIQVIFHGLNANEKGWGLRTLSRPYNYLDFDAVRLLLSPRGPLFTALTTLCNDGSTRYQLPSNLLSASRKEALCKSIETFQQLSSFSVTLNPLEYYFFHFAYVLVNPKEHVMTSWSDMSECVYSALVSDYMDYYLPVDGSTLPASSAVHSPTHSPFYSAHVGRMALKSERKPYLLRKNSAIEKLLGSEEEGGSQIASCWRSETFLSILIELWIKSYHTNSVDQMLPALDHVRFVRNLIKRIHFFSNTQARHIPAEFKRRCYAKIRAPLFGYFEFLFEFWPLDSSFKLVLEAWLSYLQPWRYVSEQQRTCDASGIVLQYQQFLAENLLFYSKFFKHMLVRLQRTDLTTPNGANMIFRLARVFGQDHLITSLVSVEGCMEQSLGMGVWNVTARQHVEELVEPGFVYIRVFVADNPLAQSVMQHVTEALSSVESVMMEMNERDKDSSFWKVLINSLTMDASTIEGSSSAEDTKRTLNSLKIGHSFFSQILQKFSSEASNISPGKTAMFHEAQLLKSGGSPVKRYPLCSTPTITSPPSFNPSPYLHSKIGLADLEKEAETEVVANRRLLTPKGRYEVVNKLRRPPVVVMTNPDLQPLRDWECAVAVRILYHISSFFNEKYREKLQSVYYQQDIIGRFYRRVLTAPGTYMHRGELLAAPPRLSLRRMGSYGFITFICVSLFVGYVLNYNPVTVILLYSFIVLGYYFLCALLEPLIK